MVEVKTLRPLEILTIRELLSYILSIANDEAQLSKVLYIHLDLLCWIICNGTENKERALNLTVELMGLFAQMLQRHKVTVPLMRRAPKPELCFDAKEFYAMPEELCVTTRIKGFQTNLRKAIAEAPDAHAEAYVTKKTTSDALTMELFFASWPLAVCGTDARAFAMLVQEILNGIEAVWAAYREGGPMPENCEEVIIKPLHS